MDEDSKLCLIVLATCLLILFAIIGLIALASKIAKIYGLTVGLLTIFLPLIVATVAMIIFLIKHGRNNDEL